MFDGRLGVADPKVPVGGASMQGRDLVGMFILQVVAQEVPEQLVVADPSTGDSVTGEEDRTSLEFHDRRSRIGPLEDVVTQVDVELDEHRRAQQEAAKVGADLVENLLGEVVGDETAAPAEAIREVGEVVASLHRDRCELEANGPPLGPVDQLLDEGWIEFASTHESEEFGSLSRVECEIATTNLGEAILEGEWERRQRRVRSRGEDQPGVPREMRHQAFEVVDEGRSQQVNVIEDDPHGTLVGADEVDERIDEQGAERVTVRVDQQGSARIHVDAVAEGAEQAPAEQLGIVVARLHGEVHHVRFGSPGGPGRQEHRLSRTGRRNDQAHSSRGDPLEQSQQPRTDDRARFALGPHIDVRRPSHTASLPERGQIRSHSIRATGRPVSSRRPLVTIAPSESE